MPYINADTQRALYERGGRPANGGELNFMLTKLVLGFLGPAPRYDDFNAAIGALECAKLELYRRMVAPYEDLKISLNGDVYPAEHRARSDDGQTG